MLVLPKQAISDAIARHTDAKSALEIWYRIVRDQRWETPMDAKRRYSSASFVKGNKVVFNIKGNKYRLVTVIDYVSEIVDVRFFGTHSEYDKINMEKL